MFWFVIGLVVGLAVGLVVGGAVVWLMVYHSVSHYSLARRAQEMGFKYPKARRPDYVKKMEND